MRDRQPLATDRGAAGCIAEACLHIAAPAVETLELEACLRSPGQYDLKNAYAARERCSGAAAKAPPFGGRMGGGSQRSLSRLLCCVAVTD